MAYTHREQVGGEKTHDESRTSRSGYLFTLYDLHPSISTHSPTKSHRHPKVEESGEEVVGGRRGLEGMEVCVSQLSLSLDTYVHTDTIFCGEGQGGVGEGCDGGQISAVAR
eukprot:5693688-Pleurochrysis_carterae.AAC.1